MKPKPKTSKPTRFLAALIVVGALILAAPSARAHDCIPIEIREYATFIRIRCSNTYGSNVDYWAVSKSDKGQAARFLAFVTLAQQTGNKFYVGYTTTNVSGCNTSNCLTPTAFGIKK